PPGDGWRDQGSGHDRRASTGTTGQTAAGCECVSCGALSKAGRGDAMGLPAPMTRFPAFSVSLQERRSSLQTAFGTYAGRNTISPAMSRETNSPRWSWWLWNALVWLGVGLFDATQSVFVMRSEGMQHAWGAVFSVLLLSWLPWALATPLVLRL